jgi:glycosyltransferase involved in cell wall biosynthesis
MGVPTQPEAVPRPPAGPNRGYLPPFFTVIITAYNRRRFLPRAIDSVLAQTVPRDRYEIVVVKNFDDEPTDRRIRENALTGIYRDDPDLGIHLRTALDQTHGEVVALLNDDDMWEPGKLALVEHRFRDRPRLGFHASSYSVIDEEDRSAADSRDRFTDLARFDARPGAVFDIGPDSPTERLEEFLRANPGSDSTISIRTSTLRRFERDLARLPSSVDTFMLTCALLSGLDLMIEYLPLTRLRVHAGNMSRATDVSFGSYLAKYGTMMGGFAAATSQMMGMAKAEGNGWVYDWLYRKNRSLSHFAAMARGDAGRAETFRSLTEDLRWRGMGQRGMLASKALYVASPRLCQAVNFLVGRRIAGG